VSPGGARGKGKYRKAKTRKRRQHNKR